MTALTDEIKTFIVKGLACYDSPSQVVEAVRAEFGIEITRQHVYAYDPKSSQRMSPRWSALHAATRAKFLRDVAAVGVSHKVVRLRKLDRMASECERDNVRLTLACLRQAAKECGGLYEKGRSARGSRSDGLAPASASIRPGQLPGNEKAPGLAVPGLEGSAPAAAGAGVQFDVGLRRLPAGACGASP